MNWTASRLLMFDWADRLLWFFNLVHSVNRTVVVVVVLINCYCYFLWPQIRRVVSLKLTKCDDDDDLFKIKCNICYLLCCCCYLLLLFGSNDSSSSSNSRETESQSVVNMCFAFHFLVRFWSFVRVDLFFLIPSLLCSRCNV